MRREEILEDYLEQHPSSIEPGLILLARQFRVIPAWAAEDKSNLDWSPYGHRPKPVDLVLFQPHDPAHVILCELKYGGGGDAGLIQLFDYWQFLREDQKVQGELRKELLKRIPPASATRLDMVGSCGLYLIVGGYVSEYLRRSVGYFIADLSSRLKMFQALPEPPPPQGQLDPPPGCQWRIQRILPADA
jgi:hypothetical protein